MDATRAKGANTEFPATRVKKMVDAYIRDTVLPEVFRSRIGANPKGIFWGQNFGIKGHEADTVAILYASTEQLFSDNIAARVLALRDHFKDDLDTAVGFVLSHITPSTTFFVVPWKKKRQRTVSEDVNAVPISFTPLACPTLHCRFSRTAIFLLTRFIPS
jgi:hypothetical protein